jgi:DNA repair exonuclease SbcCD nuclease subunit
MNNVLFFSDLHINQSSLKECILILEEIGMLANKYDVDTLINLGDTFDNLRPTSQELDIFATFIRRLGNKKHIILAAQSHESETEQQSILNHYGILSNNVQIVKEFKDGNHLFCGHFSIKESKSNYDAKLSKEEFKDYLYVFLGHIHSYSLIKPNIVHLGSSRYVDFAEAEDKAKIVALITAYGTETEKCHFMKLKTPIPMIQLQLQQKQGQNQEKNPQNTSLDQKSSKLAPISASNPSQIEVLCQTLDKTNPNTKVKVKILDFESFRKFLPLVNKYSNKFHLFKYSTEFDIISVNTQKSISTEIDTFKESLLKWLENQQIDKIIKEILLKEINE